MGMFEKRTIIDNRSDVTPAVTIETNSRKMYTQYFNDPSNRPTISLDAIRLEMLFHGGKSQSMISKSKEDLVFDTRLSSERSSFK